jgi:solute carrier family 35 protein E1
MTRTAILVAVALLATASAFSPKQSVAHSVVKSAHAKPLVKSSMLYTATTEIVADAAPKKSFIDSIWNEDTKLTAYLTVWYVGNIAYNIYNKKACNALGKDAHGHANAHWTLSAVQLLVGVLFVVPMWLTGIRKAPEMTLDNWKEMFPTGLFACLAHAFSVIALGAGAVSFGQIVKAGEPVFAAATNALLLGDIDHPMVYAALLPIIGGVSLASIKELSFSWNALIAASGTT